MRDVHSVKPAAPSICGVGAVTGYGWGAKYLWDGVQSGESAVTLTPGYGSVLPRDEAYVARVPDGGSPSDGRSRFLRATRAAVREAVEDAYSRGWRPGPTVGLLHGAVLGEVDLWRDFYLVDDMNVARKRYIEQMPSTPITAIMKEHELHGPVMNVGAMCASGNAALITAAMWIRAGMATDVIVLSTDISATPENLRPFVNLGVAIPDLPPLDACRPFQDGSRGFVVGEASVAMVVSGRPTGSYATLRGGALAHDGFHAVSINPNLNEIFRCVDLALETSGVSRDEIVYLNAHGPGTRQCDTAEARVLDELLPGARGVFSFKPLTGHCQAATAAVEVAVSCMSYDTGLIPAPPKVASGHPRLVNGLTRRHPGPTLKTSIGMGGNNSAIVLDEPS